MLTEKAIIIINNRTKKTEKALLKICKDCYNHKGIFLLSNNRYFDGIGCNSDDKEGFKFSWVLKWESHGDLDLALIPAVINKYFPIKLPECVNNKSLKYFKLLFPSQLEGNFKRIKI